MNNDLQERLIRAVVNNLGIEEGIELINDTINKIKKEYLDFLVGLRNARNDYCEDSYFCYNCMEHAINEDLIEKHPYGDIIVNETVSKIVCPECRKEF